MWELGLDAEVANEARKDILGSWVSQVCDCSDESVISISKLNLLLLLAPEFCSEGRHLLISIGNGKSSGGGFYLTPQASLDDGWLDVCIAKESINSRDPENFSFCFIWKHAGFEKIANETYKEISGKTQSKFTSAC